MNRIRIVSGGQTGVDRAGLDAAIELGLKYGGWVPKGRIAEDGVAPEKYHSMVEHSGGYPARTKANVRDSDATLIIVPRYPLSRGTLLTLRTAEKLARPHHIVCLENPKAVSEVREWLDSFQKIDREFVLNIAGPRESGAPGIQASAKEFLRRVFAE